MLFSLYRFVRSLEMNCLHHANHSSSMEEKLKLQKTFYSIPKHEMQLAHWKVVNWTKDLFNNYHVILFVIAEIIQWTKFWGEKKIVCLSFVFLTKGLDFKTYYYRNCVRYKLIHLLVSLLPPKESYQRAGGLDLSCDNLKCKHIKYESSVLRRWWHKISFHWKLILTK